MKNIGILLAAVSALLFSCGRQEAEKLNKQNDSLVSVLKENENKLNIKETAFNEIISSFNDIARNLDSVAARQKIIYSTTDKGVSSIEGNRADKINAQINAINSLMDENRRTIAGLSGQLKSAVKKNSALEESVRKLTERLAKKDEELASLNEKLNSLNSQLAQLQSSYDTLNSQNTRQSKTLADRTAALHTAYYIVGKPRELREAKVIGRTGGLLGVGKTSKLTRDFDRSKFTRIDYTATSVVPVNSDKIKIITNHPSDSYRLEKDSKDKDLVKNLVITDPEKFWSVSKYLVIEGNPIKGSGSSVVSDRNRVSKSTH
jgi:uncharacterized protein YoxC